MSSNTKGSDEPRVQVIYTMAIDREVAGIKMKHNSYTRDVNNSACRL